MNEHIKNTYGDDPVALCQQWLEEASALEPHDPEAVTLATATKSGMPSLRWVLIKDISERGFKFHTNIESQKGQELLENPYAALCFYWKSTRKQIRIEGVVERISDAEADEYFASRSRARQIGAWASQQSRPYDTPEDMNDAIKKYEEKFTNIENIARPPYWTGFRLAPSSIEFWLSHKDRLHTRFKFIKNGDDWTTTWLCP